MRRRRTKARLALACCLALLAGCGGATTNAPAPGPDQVMAELSAFTDELARKVEGAQDPAAGVAEAQTLLDSRKAALAAGIKSMKASPRFREDQEARRRWLEAEVDNTTRVSGLKARLIEPAMRDPSLGPRLDRLVEGYQELFKD
ncbi:MAG TPA: hypothetical protein VK422_07485 [Pyrinomonadaceae bacterium]|nr:hypothetical protein [Pyrinomonadaceae bacterium]